MKNCRHIEGGKTLCSNKLNIPENSNIFISSTSNYMVIIFFKISVTAAVLSPETSI
jgi:hypothetical protein